MAGHRCPFVDEVLAAAGDEAAQRRVCKVLKRWAGERVYLRQPDAPRPREIAAQLLGAGVIRGEAVRILMERTGLSERQCWRYLSDAR